MNPKIYIVDAFASRTFGGNQAAVCRLESECSSEWMQALAREMNYSETAFLVRKSAGYQLRWFTPGYEVDLCGHATLASAHILWSELGETRPEISFESRSGLLRARRDGEWIELDFPATPAAATEPLPGLLEALGADPIFTGKSRFDAVVVLKTEAEVWDLKPDFRRLGQVPVRGVIVTARADGDGFERPEADFISRFFAPTAGINEDPVTGSAHCCLSPYWSDKMGRNELVGYQASSRGGVVRTRFEGERVHLGGQAVTVVCGQLAISPDSL